MSAKLQVDATLIDPAGWRPKKSRFFLGDEELVIFKAEHTLFRVHRYFLGRDSEFFRGLFLCPPGKGGAEGKTEQSPIELYHVTAFEFECLIDFLYNGMYDSVSRPRTPIQWTALLSIFSRFMFDKIRVMSTNALEALSPPLNPVDRIILSMQFDIPHWLKPALVDLCMRQQPLSDVEGRRVGLKASLQISRARERFKTASTSADRAIQWVGQWCYTCNSHRPHASSGRCVNCNPGETIERDRERARLIVEDMF
ncbi:hypothetical protein OBBRIDRAFT_103898 [Obba rivulosa]|uniref:BTB domain-containing protein n=1 Tax=Obba rivulosa TaxID=1052685 RepID=A0A8E2J4Y3_9APHY|nr:hypothetical protein OBBRIDRAFT_103898 [Obba rivulosa]